MEQRTGAAPPGSPLADVELRAARPDDLPALLDIYNHWVRVSTATFDLEPLTLDAWRPWFEQHRHPDRPLLVAERIADGGEGRELLGGAWLSGWRPRPGFARTAESSIYLHPEARTRGLGRALYGALIDRARERGMHTLIAVITPPNPASVELHRSLGYERVGVTREVGWKFERWQDSEIWQLLLEGPAAEGDAAISAPSVP
jgi:phosphinothricin acetyltransferase